MVNEEQKSASDSLSLQVIFEMAFSIYSILSLGISLSVICLCHCLEPLIATSMSMLSCLSFIIDHCSLPTLQLVKYRCRLYVSFKNLSIVL